MFSCTYSSSSHPGKPFIIDTPSSLLVVDTKSISIHYHLQVGDRVGVIRKDNGNLIFYVNGVEQGLAASNVPERIYGVVDLYGQAAQASIVQHSEHCSSDVLPSSLSSSTIYRSVFRNKRMRICEKC